MIVAYGIILIMFGGLASGAFYLPLKFVKNWAWESGWSIYSFFALLIGPWVLAMATIPDLFSIIGSAEASSIYWPIIFGVGWGIGGLTWGLSIRYLGIGLGNALPLGLTSALSTVISPLVPIFLWAEHRPDGLGNAITTQMGKMFEGQPGALILGSIIMSLAGIAICGWAASRKDKELKDDAELEKQEFDLKKGLVVALVAGVMSACFAFGEKAGESIARSVDAIVMSTEALEAGKTYLWRYNPVYAVLLIGGFSFNIIYCIYLGFKNNSFKDFTAKSVKLTRNYAFAALAGIVWFAQFVFKGMGTTKIPEDLSFITWTLLFTFVIVFSNLIGIMTKEWKGVSRKTMIVLISGLLVLILSVAMVGAASYLKQ